jgi:chorismate mutase
LAGVCQKAADLTFDGLFIESHIDPDKALSDKAQQVTPEALEELLSSLIWRKPEVGTNGLMHDLEILRSKIDQIDDEVLHIFKERMKVVEKIGELKKKNKVTILQASRWSEILDERKEVGKKLGLSEDFISTVLKAVHQESINTQTRIMNKEI